MLTIAIDGTSGSGKSTIAGLLAKKLNILHFNTGAIYRAVGLYLIQNDINVYDKEKVINELKNIHIDIKFENHEQVTILNGVDISNDLYSMKVSDVCSVSAAYMPVREMVVEIQRNVAKNFNVVIEGRDITSHVLPNARFKFYIDASPEVRAKRRISDKKNIDKNLNYETVLSEIIERDRRDKQRDVCPLLLVEGTDYILNDDLSIDEAVDLLYNIVKGIIK